jgi:hypothetical protein
MIELTDYALEVLREHPREVRELQERRAITRAIKSCGLVVVSIKEMNVLLGTEVRE